MGQHDVQQQQDERALRAFTRHLIQDVRALEHMLEHDLFETGVRRIGAEQELFLVDERYHPAPVIEAVMAHNTDERVVTELTQFNLEFNLDPLSFGGDCLSRMEQQLTETMASVRALVDKVGARVVMAGILPTVTLSDLSLDHMTPSPRYFALNDAIQQLRGGVAQFHIQGVDELFVKHDSIMLEGVNTSFQTHFQVAPDEFPHLYNIAQVVAAPCLAVAANSPLLFGKRLWRETRIALFQQAVDTRSSNLYLRDMSPRVHFGTSWVRESVTEIFKEDISRFRVLLTTELTEDPMAVLEEGGTPDLQALQLHNGTVYRWNRACYGMTNGMPHLRIENRILPSGPTPVDEVANAALWFGLVSGLAARYEDITAVMDFDDAKNNFVAAARQGLSSQFTWFDGEHLPAHELLVDRLIPLAREGLVDAGVDATDADRYLNIVQARTESRQTGSQWQLRSLAAMKGRGTRAERLGAMVSTLVRRQEEGEPVHTWELASFDQPFEPHRVRTTRVEDYMVTDLFTVHQEESVEFVACLMDWQRIRQVLVEDEQHRLVGLVSHRSLLRFLAEHSPSQESFPVREIMVRDPISVPPEMSALEAIRLMRKHQIGSLPVVRDDQLVGIITEREFFHIAGQLLDSARDGEGAEADAARGASPTELPGEEAG